MCTQYTFQRRVGVLFFSMLFFIAAPAFANAKVFTLTYHVQNLTGKKVQCEPYKNSLITMSSGETKTVQLPLHLAENSEWCTSRVVCEMTLPIKLHWDSDNEEFWTSLGNFDTESLPGYGGDVSGDSINPFLKLLNESGSEVYNEITALNKSFSYHCSFGE